MPAWFVRCVVAVMLLAAAGCYRPAFEDCALTCGPGALCPDNLQCASGYCRIDPGATTSCPALLDGSLPPEIDASKIDADPAQPDAGACTCDPHSQSCCALDQACDLNGSGATYCRAVAAMPGQQSLPCSAASACARRFSCVGPDGTVTAGATTCHQFCLSDFDCGGGGGLCDVTVAGSSVKVCTTNCNPITHSPCAGNFACTPQLGDHWHTDCRPVPAAAFPQGHDCTRDDECRRNLICTGTPGRCAKVCSMSAPGGSGCPGMTTCTRLGTGAIFSGVEYGACL